MNSRQRSLSLAVLALGGAGWWITWYTQTSLFGLIATLVVAALMFIPLGALVVRIFLPEPPGRAVQMALILGVGFVLTPFVILLLGAVGHTDWFVALSAALLMLWVYLEWRTPTIVLSMTRPPFRSGLILIAALSLVAISPLLKPMQRVSDSSFVNYAFIDEFYHLSLVQGLIRDVPLSEWPDMAGSVPAFYPLGHHVIEATMARVVRTDPRHVAFVYGPVILIVLTLILSYAVGLIATGSSWGGGILASLQYLVLVPNLYDRNLVLANETVPLLPNFYQLHFYGLRYAAHSVSGDVVMLTVILAAFVALSSKTDRARLGALSIVSIGVAALFQFRTQFALALIPSSLALQLGFLAWRRQARFAIPIAIFLLLLVPTLLSSRAYPTTGLVLQYGGFGGNVVRKSFLPTLARSAISTLPEATQPAVGVATLLILRIVGVNALLLILFSVCSSALRKQLKWQHLYLLMTILGALVAATFVEQAAAVNNLGMNILMACRMPTLILVVPALVHAGRVLQVRYGWIGTRRTASAVVLLVVFTIIAYRGADAALHDRLDRAYPFSSEELAAYEWIRASTPPDAVLAANPTHRVNTLGERIQDTNVLSGMTGRRVYIQRITPFISVEGNARASQLRTLFSTPTPDDACRIIETLRFDYLLEYDEERLSAGPLPCLTLAYAGTPRVYARR